MNHFQRLNEVKELKIFFFAQFANTQKQASNRRPLQCDAMAPTVQNRTRQCCAQQTSSYITALPWPPGLIVGPCPSEESLCCPACPPPLFFLRLSAPGLQSCVSHFLVFALHLYVSYFQSHHFPWLQPHALQSIRFSRLTAIRTHHPMTHVSLEEAPSQLWHTVFLQRGCCCQGKEVVPIDHITGWGAQFPSYPWSKIRLTAGFEPGTRTYQFSCSTLSLSMCTLFCAFNTWVRCITFFLGLAASHSSKDPPSVAERHHIFRRTLLPWPIDYLHLPIEQCALVL